MGESARAREISTLVCGWARDGSVPRQSPAACASGSAGVGCLEWGWDDSYILVYDEAVREKIVQMLREGRLAGTRCATAIDVG
jgi:hypothetical protein